MVWSWKLCPFFAALALVAGAWCYASTDFEPDADTLMSVVSDGGRAGIPFHRLHSLAEFHRAVLRACDRIGIPVAINDLPCEIANAVRLSSNHAPATYDSEYAHRFWQVLLNVDRVFKQFRTGFIGKVSPVHFFWGSFDLAVTRFSGRRAPLFTAKTPGLALEVMQEAYSHEVSSAGFWPGGNGVDASFYSYAYPAPAGYGAAAVRPAAASFDATLGEFLLPYAAVRAANDPEAILLEFLQSTYEAAANLAHWDRAALECPPGHAGPLRRA